MAYLKKENLGSGQLDAKEKWLLRNFLENLSVSRSDPDGNQV